MDMHLESRAYRQMAKKSEKKYSMLLPQKEVKYTCIRSIDSNSIWIWTRGKPSFTDASCVYYPEEHHERSTNLAWNELPSSSL